MSVPDEIERLRKQAAELIERAARRDKPLSPEEDAEIMALLTKAQDLEHREREDKKAHSKTPERGNLLP